MDQKQYLILFSFLLGFQLLQGQSTRIDYDQAYIYKSGSERIISDQERPEGQRFKVEVARLSQINERDPELKRLQKIGTVFIERIDNQGVYALLIGAFREKSDAQSALQKIRSSGYETARIITYQDGLRAP